MVNPLRKLKRKEYKHLTKRQRMIVRRCRKTGREVRVYRRKASRNKLSVRNPFKKRGKR